jgi:hypothetical protein
MFLSTVQRGSVPLTKVSLAGQFQTCPFRYRTLIQWGLEASKRERSRPHLVERDEDGGAVQNEAIREPISGSEPRCLSFRPTRLEELDAQQTEDTEITEPQEWTPYQRYLHQFLRTLMKYANGKISQNIK